MVVCSENMTCLIELLIIFAHQKFKVTVRKLFGIISDKSSLRTDHHNRCFSHQIIMAFDGDTKIISLLSGIFLVKLPFCLAVFFFKQCETYLSSSLRVVGFNCSKSEVIVSAQTDQKSKSKPSFVLFSLNTEVVFNGTPLYCFNTENFARGEAAF